MLAPSSPLPRVKWVFEHQVEVDANEKLDGQVDQGEAVDLSREQHNNHLKVLVDDIIVNLLDPVHWEVVSQEYVNLRGANNHPHESKVNSCLHQARCRDKVVWVDVTQS